MKKNKRMLRLAHIVGTMNWYLVEDFEFMGLKVPAGYKSDLASVPRLLWWLLPPCGRYLEAAIVHDYCYTDMTDEMTRKDADVVFLQGMKKLGINRVRRTLMYWAVRLFGRGEW